ncbi:cell envelope integrity protein CreD [Leucothrix pacifica]|uniref:Cell envelope integrity protein CreD n=1 Tax=Leucothrix pacifica TaxID=1247513 RepID=A0A317CGP8_9GAMM|nr:cell envelope integrity protein CreD [Leucothrix pacifica]PWQ97706.1 cell envelope integrity protein CreD [Leucothrix pacifica]
MEIIFSIFALVVLAAIGVGSVMVLLFFARKMGLISPQTATPAKTEASGDWQATETSPSQGFQLPKLKGISQSLITRFVLVAILSLLMNIPLNMVESVVRERGQLYNSVLNSIASTWGKQQRLSGPTLLIPYTEKFVTENTLTDKDGNERKVNKTSYKQRTAIVLPESLDINSDLKGHERTRGIYKSLVYSADLSLKGHFKRPDIESLSNYIDEIHWEKAWVALGVSDTRAINKVSALRWSDQRLDFEPGTRVTSLIQQGFHAPLSIDKTQSRFEYSLDLNINGSSGFYFEPFAKTTDVKITSDWPHPSFQGSVLPTERSITDNGFEAHWSIPHLARNFPQMWIVETQQFNVHEFSAGVNLFEPISLYSQITRTIKYGILFIALTYITFVIFELGIQKRLHIVQYGVIGLALTMFYLSLLSLAEHIDFMRAYIAAAALISIMISLYAYSAVRSLSRAGLVFVLLSGLYFILYSLLKLEDYALLVGTGLLLLILAVVMYFTRHIGNDKDASENPVTPEVDTQSIDSDANSSDHSPKENRLDTPDSLG